MPRQPKALDPQYVLTIPEAADALNIGRDLAYKAAREGRLPTLKLGRRWIVPRHALETLLGSSTCESGLCSCVCHTNQVVPAQPQASTPLAASHTVDVDELAKCIVAGLVTNKELHEAFGARIAELLPMAKDEPLAEDADPAPRQRPALRVDGDDVLVTTAELSQWIGCSDQTIRVWISTGKLRPIAKIPIGRRPVYRIPREQLDRLEERLPVRWPKNVPDR